MAEENNSFRQVFWTTVVVGMATVIFGSALRLIERDVINKSAYQGVRGYFRTMQPDYFPLLYLLVAFVFTFAVVWLYRMVAPQLPRNWIIRGLLVGSFLFVAGDLPHSIHTGYTTIIPARAAQGMALTALLNRLIDGCILTYTYMRLSPEWRKQKA